MRLSKYIHYPIQITDCLVVDVHQTSKSPCFSQSSPASPGQARTNAGLKAGVSPGFGQARQGGSWGLGATLAWHCLACRKARVTICQDGQGKEQTTKTKLQPEPAQCQKSDNKRSQRETCLDDSHCIINL